MSQHRRRASHSIPGTTSVGLTMDALSVACTERFLSPAYLVRRDDESETMWVSRNGGPLWIGLRPNMIERHGFEFVLDDAHARLSAAEVKAR